MYLFVRLVDGPGVRWTVTRGGFESAHFTAVWLLSPRLDSHCTFYYWVKRCPVVNRLVQRLLTRCNRVAKHGPLQYANPTDFYDWNRQKIKDFLNLYGVYRIGLLIENMFTDGRFVRGGYFPRFGFDNLLKVLGHIQPKNIGLKVSPFFINQSV